MYILKPGRLLDTIDPSSEYRLLGYRAFYVYVVVFIIFGIIKPTYAVYWLAMPMMAIANYFNPTLNSFAKKDLSVVLFVALSAFCVYAMNVLWNSPLYFYLFVASYFAVLSLYSIRKNPPFFMIVTQSLMFGLVSVYNYSGNEKLFNDYINQILDILCIGIIVFWTLKLYPNDAQKEWRGIYREFFNQLAKRVAQNADNYMTCAELRGKIHTLNRLLLTQKNGLKYIRFYLESYRYQSVVENLLLGKACDKEKDFILQDIKSLQSAIHSYSKCKPNSSIAIESYKHSYNKLASLWNAIC